MKKLLLLTLCVIILAAGCGKTEENPYSSVGKAGNIPAQYTGALIEKELLLKAAILQDGYLLPTESGVKKYDLAGKLLWKKDYSFISEKDHFSSLKITPAADGSFLISFQIYTYQGSDTKWYRFDPVLAKCDKNGNLLWQLKYEDFSDSTLEKVFCLENGNIITIGYTKTKTEEPDIYLSLVSEDGVLIDEKYYGGSDYEYLYNAEYAGGIGLIATVYTQSSDGTFAELNSTDIILLINNDLNIIWQKKADYYLSRNSMRVSNDAIYLLCFKAFVKNIFLKLDFNGNTVYEEVIVNQDGVFAHLVGFSKYGLLIQKGDELVFFNDSTEVLNIEFEAGSAERIIDIADGFIIVSVNITGVFPTSLIISSIWYYTELVYSGYDGEGNLLWRNVYDNTPDYPKI